MRWARTWCVGLTATLLTGSAIAGSGADAVDLPRTPAAEIEVEAPPTVDVDGAMWLKDGVQWTPHGFNMIGLAAPGHCVEAGNAPSPSVTARRIFAKRGRAELLAARDGWGADTVRFQISQRGLQWRYPGTDSYLQRIKDGVALARRLNLVVILSMQDQKPACGDETPLPTQDTVTAWHRLRRAVGSNPGVMFELYNEPTSTKETGDEAPKGWHAWKYGNPDRGFVGHQTLVNKLRRWGARNVLLADGAYKAESWVNLGDYRLRDPGNDHVDHAKIGYATHPYIFHWLGNTAEQDRDEWDRRFGHLTQDRGFPMIATEWNAIHKICLAGSVSRVDDILGYLSNNGIGIVAHAFDTGGRTVRTFARNDAGNVDLDRLAWEPTDLDGPVCGADCERLSNKDAAGR